MGCQQFPPRSPSEVRFVRVSPEVPHLRWNSPQVKLTTGETHLRCERQTPDSIRPSSYFMEEPNKQRWLIIVLERFMAAYPVNLSQDSTFDVLVQPLFQPRNEIFFGFGKLRVWLVWRWKIQVYTKKKSARQFFGRTKCMHEMTIAGQNVATEKLILSTWQ